MKTQRNYLHSADWEVFKIINPARAEKQRVKRRGISTLPSAGDAVGAPREGDGANASSTWTFRVSAPVPVPPQPRGCSGASLKPHGDMVDTVTPKRPPTSLCSPIQPPLPSKPAAGAVSHQQPCSKQVSAILPLQQELFLQQIIPK